MDRLKGYKTYLTALGLVGLGVFQFSTGDVAGGIQSILGAAAAASLRSAVANPGVPPAVPLGGAGPYDPNPGALPTRGPSPAGMGGRSSM